MRSIRRNSHPHDKHSKQQRHHNSLQVHPDVTAKYRARQAREQARHALARDVSLAVRAVRDRELHLLEQVLARAPDTRAIACATTMGESQRPLLSIAVREANAQAVQRLLDAGAPRDTVDSLGAPVLVASVRLGHVECTRVLLEAGGMFSRAQSSFDLVRLACATKRRSMIELVVSWCSDLRPSDRLLLDDLDLTESQRAAFERGWLQAHERVKTAFLACTLSREAESQPVGRLSRHSLFDPNVFTIVFELLTGRPPPRRPAPQPPKTPEPESIELSDEPPADWELLA